VKLYEAVRLVDYVFMLVMLQTHPYWKGQWLSRLKLVIYSLLACILGFVFVELLLVRVITTANAGKYMRWTAVLSFFLYPILNCIIASFNYKRSGWGVFGYFFAELFKFFFLFIMREGLHEIINKSHNALVAKERFRALGIYIENVFKFLCFIIFGSIITKFMKSMRIQQMNPWNYLISFLILCLPLLIVYLLLLRGKTKDQAQDKNGKYKDPAFDNGYGGGYGGGYENDNNGDSAVLEVNGIE